MRLDILIGNFLILKKKNHLDYQISKFFALKILQKIILRPDKSELFDLQKLVKRKLS